MRKGKTGRVERLLRGVAEIRITGAAPWKLINACVRERITVEGVECSEDTVKDGTYLVQRPFVLVTKEGVALSETAQKFFDFATSADAAEIISAAGAVAAADEAVQE